MTLVIASPASYAYNKLYHTYSETSTLSPGVTLTNEQRMTDTGWFNVNLVTIDLTNPAAQSTVLLPEYISEKATLMNLANAEDDIVAAINGDFFDTQGKSTLGMVVKDGEYVTSSIHDDRFYTYLQMKDGRSYIAKVLGESTKLSKEGFSLDITYKNKPYLQYDRAIVFDRNWGNASIGNTNSESVIELVVVNDEIISIALDPAPQKIPENGYIVSAVGTLISQIYANFKVGDTVELSDGSFISHIDQAIGGGAKILTDGVPETDFFSLNISGRHPRSALGFSEDNTKLFLVTIDGRNGDFTGMTQTELAYLIAEAGAYNAINLDGGGSSELVAKRLGENSLEIINHPSDGAERRIHNGIGVKNVGEKGPLDQLLIDTEQDRYFVGSSISLNIKGIDANYHPVSLSDDSFRIEATGVEYKIEDGEVIPLEEGEITITVYQGQAMGKIKTEVIGEPKRISVYPQTARLMPGESLNISLTGYDENGFSAPLKLKDVNILQSGVNGSLSDSKYTVTESGSGYIRFSLGEADAFMSLGVGESVQPLHAFEEQFGEFVSYPSSVSGSYALTNFSHTGGSGGTLQYDFRTDTATRAAYVKFGENGLSLPDNTNKLRLWVFGDYANNHWLRGKATDSNGEVHTIDFTKSVDWTGWQQVEAPLPVGSDFVSLDRLYVVETDPAIRDAGVLVFDDLEAVVTADPPENLNAMSASSYNFSTLEADSTDLIVDIKVDSYIEKSEEERSSDLNEPVPAVSSVIKLSDNRLISILNQSTEILSINNDGRFINRTSNTEGWNSLLDFVPSESTKDVIVLLSDTFTFKNSFDKKLFKDKLNLLRSELGKRVIVISPGRSDTLDLIDGLWFVTYDQDGETQLRFDLDHEVPQVEKVSILKLDI